MHRTVPLQDKHVAQHRRRRSFVLPGKRLPGLLALVLLPALAVAGLTSLRGQATTTGAALELLVDYPRVVRYLEPVSLDVTLLNTGERPLTDVQVQLDRSYLAAFTGLTIMPAETGVTAEAVLVDAGTIQPGQTAHLRLELRANRYWYQPGSIAVSHGSGRLQAAFGTLMLP